MEPVVSLAEQVVHPGLGFADGDGALGQFDALVILAVLAGDHGDIIERVGIGRVVRQHVDIALHGEVQLALAVVKQALLQQGRHGGVVGLLLGLLVGHGGCLVSLSVPAKTPAKTPTNAPKREAWYGFCTAMQQ